MHELRVSRFKSLAVSVFGLDVSARRYPKSNSLFADGACRGGRRMIVRVAPGAVIVRRRRLCRAAAPTGLPALPDRRAGGVGAAVVVRDGGAGGRLGGVVERVVASVKQARSAGAAVAGERRLRAELLVRQRAVLGQVRPVEVGQRRAARPRSLDAVQASFVHVRRVPVHAAARRPAAEARVPRRTGGQ